MYTVYITYSPVTAGPSQEPSRSQAKPSQACRRALRILEAKPSAKPGGHWRSSLQPSRKGAEDKLRAKPGGHWRKSLQPSWKEAEDKLVAKP